MDRTRYSLSELASRLEALPQEAPSSGRILIVDEEGDACRQALAGLLPHCHFTLVSCPETARRELLSSPLDLVILSHSERINCLEWLPRFKSLRPSVSIFVVTDCGCEDLAVQAFRHGATDYFRKSLDLPALESSIRAVLDSCRKANGNGIQHSEGGLLKALGYMAGNFHTPISLARAACEAGMSISCFERNLKQLTGKTFVVYLNGLRVARAKELLRSNRSPMLKVALACGFTNQSHFNRVFRKAAGVTPGEYRKSVSYTPSQS